MKKELKGYLQQFEWKINLSHLKMNRRILWRCHKFRKCLELQICSTLWCFYSVKSLRSKKSLFIVILAMKLLCSCFCLDLTFIMLEIKIMRNKENQIRNQILLNIYAKKFESERCLKSIFLFGIFPTFFSRNYSQLSCQLVFYI